MSSPRGTREQDIGRAAEKQVAAAFDLIGWASIGTHGADLGTDLIATPRHRRFDAGALLGVQVKTGDTAFRSPIRKRGEIIGWWFTDRTSRHVPGWLQHMIPHIIVLHDIKTNCSYWAHVTHGAVERSGLRGQKLRVLASQTIDQAHAEQLLSVGLSRLPRIEVQGTAWTGLDSIAPPDRLRHALIVPRLLAPHPNAGTATPITAESAVALLVLGRWREIDRFAAQHPSVPTIAQAEKHADWAWRFAWALWRRLQHGELDPVLAAVETAPDVGARCAAIAISTAELIERGESDAAQTRLATELQRDKAEPIDHAWLQVQSARASAETGDARQAEQAALAAQIARLLRPQDLTASAIAGSAARLLFTLGVTRQSPPPANPSPQAPGALAAGESPEAAANVQAADTRVSASRPARGPLEALITDTDTAADWWQSQTLASGLASLIDREIRRWSSWGASRDDGAEARRLLRSAATIASTSGNQPGWCHATALDGHARTIRLTRWDEPEEAAAALKAMSSAGDERFLREAIQRLASDGPVTAIKLVLNELSPGALTRTSAPSALTLLEHGGDLLDDAQANLMLEWLQGTITDPQPFIKRTRPSYYVPSRLIEALIGVLPAADYAHRRSALEGLLRLAPQNDDLEGSAWSWLARAIPERDLTDDDAEVLAQHAARQPDQLRVAMLSLAATRDQIARESLVAEATRGSYRAFASVRDVRTLPSSSVATLIQTFATATSTVITNAHKGAFTDGESRIEGLVLLNAWFPDLADWNPIVELLKDQTVNPQDQSNAASALARHTDRTPQNIKEQLAPHVLRLTTPRPTNGPMSYGQSDLQGAATELAYTLGLVDDATTKTNVMRLLAADPQQRAWAARICGSSKDTELGGVLLNLTLDEHPQVRATAASWLAYKHLNESSDSTIVAALNQCAGDPGRRVPAALAAELALAKDQSDETTQKLITELRAHPSARVRNCISPATWR